MKSDDKDDCTVLDQFEFERPRCWLQYSDGTWEPVWADGSVGDPDMASNLVCAVRGNGTDLDPRSGLTQRTDTNP
ncbi:hypothetical protein ABZ319_28980 [Nocardia sp. NPDC005978]|uniref:hypothetical protein n=1 Tax=Nocardia sp. NPDC005978 TaxID=3156725 RepID=UPI0033A014A9